MSAGKLVPKQSFGINPVTRNCLSFTQDHHVAYTSGHQVAVLNTETKEQQFLSGTSSYQHQSQGITAIVTSISRKLVAVAEKVDPTAIVTFYDGVTLRRKKVLTYSELGSNEIRCLAFSDDGKFLLTQGCGPEWNLVLWNIEKSIKVVTSVKISMSDDTPVYQISFCPWDSNVVVVLGKCILRLFRFTEGQLRPLSLTVRRDQATFIGHCWLPDDNLVLATEAGEVLLVENYEYRAVIYPPAGEQEELVPITCVGACSRGFVVGTGKGEIRLFEKQDDIKEKFQLDEAYPVPAEKGNIVTIAVGPDETLICATDKHQLLSLSLGNLNNSVKENTGGVFDNALTSFHCPNEAGKSAIIAIDTALWKHVIVSIGKDRSMRVWNAADKKMELIKLFDDEPISLSVHPSGLYVAVAFQDKVKVMSLLLEDIHLCREIAARQCSYVKFSKGGEYLAVSNGSNLQIHDTHTRNAVATLRGHNNKIRSAVWLNFDSKIMTVGAEGVIYFWDLFPVNRHMEHYAGNQPVSIGTGPADGTKAIIATHEKTVKEITFAAGQFVEMSNVKQNTNYSSTSGSANNSSEGAIYKPSQEIDLGSHVSCMLYDESRKMVIMGTDDPDNPGNIICALTSPQLNSSYDVNTLHSGPITALCMSYDGHAIYSGDTNGCLVISEFEKSYGGAQNKQRDGIISFEFIDEVLIHKTDLDAREGEITRLTLRVDELNQNNEHQLRLKEIEHKDKLREITEKFTSQLLSEKSKYEELESEKLSIEQDFNRKMKMLEDKQGDELRAIELKYKTKVNAEENRHKILLEETENAHRRWNEENQTLVESHQKYLQELTLEYEEKLLAEQRAQQDITSVKQHYKVRTQELHHL